MCGLTLKVRGHYNLKFDGGKKFLKTTKGVCASVCECVCASMFEKE